MICEKPSRISLPISALLSLVICTFASSFAAAQEKPIEFSPRLDDKLLCSDGNSFNSTEYCEFWRTYTSNRTKSDESSRAAAKDARNELIKYVQGRIDSYYEESTNKKKFNRTLLQTIFDVLEIGAAATIGIIKGEHAKDVLAVTLTGFQAARTSLNKNFDLLQTRIVINKMRENRAQILTRIIANLNKPVSDYSWIEAKNDLRQFFYAGTFNNALDSLAAETGAAAQNAETTLRVVSGDIVVVPESTSFNVERAANANQILEELKKKLGDEVTKAAALDTLKNIFDELKEDDILKPLLEAGTISESSNGEVMIDRIFVVRRQVTLKGRTDLARKINETIVKAVR